MISLPLGRLPSSGVVDQPYFKKNQKTDQRPSKLDELISPSNMPNSSFVIKKLFVSDKLVKEDCHHISNKFAVPKEKHNEQNLMAKNIFEAAGLTYSQLLLRRYHRFMCKMCRLKLPAALPFLEKLSIS